MTNDLGFGMEAGVSGQLMCPYCSVVVDSWSSKFSSVLNSNTVPTTKTFESSYA